MIEAVYAVHEYLQPFIDAVLAQVEFVPGNSADETNQREFILYSIVPNTGYDLYMLHYDTINYKIVTTDFEKTNKIAQVLLEKLNVEDIEGLVSESNIRFQDAHLMARGSGNDHFVDGDDFYFILLQLELQYTVLA